MAEGSSMLSASDVAMLQKDNGIGDNSFIWFLAIMILLFGGGFGNGFGNNRGYEPQYATQQDVQNTAQYGNLLDGNRDIMNAINNGTARAVQATDQAKYETINVAKDLQAVMLGQIGDVKVGQSQALANQNECCSNTRLEIANSTAELGAQISQNRYDLAMNTAAINANLTKEIQSVKDMLMQQRNEEQAARIQKLETQNALAGVVRYPNAWTFNAGAFPGCFNCQCGNV